MENHTISDRLIDEMLSALDFNALYSMARASLQNEFLTYSEEQLKAAAVDFDPDFFN